MPSPLRALGLAAVVFAAAVSLGWLGLQWHESRLPGTYNVMEFGRLDYGGGRIPERVVPHGAVGHEHAGARLVSVASLTGPREAVPDRRFTVTAQNATVTLPSGRRIEAPTFDGRVPGPELRARHGELVEVTLRNRDVAAGVSLHWHGVDVPNAEDGVSGVTQDAVGPGEEHAYRFRVDQVGTFWYHTHQSSARGVKRGLYGAIVIEPRRSRPPGTLDQTVVVHRFGSTTTLNGRDGVWRKAVRPGTSVRLRLVNSDSTRQRILTSRVPFRVLGIDGTELHSPTPLLGRSLALAAGGRYDIGFPMPNAPVTVGVARTETRLVLSPRGDAVGSPPPDAPEFDPTAYGRPAATPFGAASRYDRRFTLEIGKELGFRDGRLGRHWTVNGGIYPDVPTFVVEEGDLVRMTIVNDTGVAHPMHLHGHHMLVLSRNGRRVSGSPWWSDTLDVGPHERYDIAFRADNPGLWMDHCHNLDHAAEGLTMHLVYAGVETPFVVGGRARNRPE